MRKRSGVPLTVLNLREAGGMGGEYTYAYIVGMGQNGNPTYAKIECIVGAPPRSLSIKHRTFEWTEPFAAWKIAILRPILQTKKNRHKSFFFPSSK